MKPLVFGDSSLLNPNAINIDLYTARGGDLVYDGVTLPFKDEAFDLLESNQVMEHCFYIKEFYREAARVLRVGGCLEVSFPHRFVPYDSHSRTWFVHWFYPKLYHPEYFNWQTTRYHRNLAKKYFIIENRAAEIRVDYSIYEGPRTLRWLAEHIPFIGYFRQVHWRLIKEAK